MIGPTTPYSKNKVWALPRSLAATQGISVLISFPPPTEMFQFGGCRLLNLWIQLRIIRHYSDWVPPFGNLRVNAFFQLTEAYRRFRVLHRLLMPRHPPIALNSLTINFSISIKFLSFLRLRHELLHVYYLLTFCVKMILKR